MPTITTGGTGGYTAPTMVGNNSLEGNHKECDTRTEEGSRCRSVMFQTPTNHAIEKRESKTFFLGAQVLVQRKLRETQGRGQECEAIESKTCLYRARYNIWPYAASNARMRG